MNRRWSNAIVRVRRGPGQNACSPPTYTKLKSSGPPFPPTLNWFPADAATAIGKATRMDRPQGEAVTFGTRASRGDN